MPDHKTCNEGDHIDCAYKPVKYALPPMLRDILIGCLTVGIIGMISTVLRMNTTLEVMSTSQSGRNINIESVISELRDNARQTKSGLERLDSAFARFESASYTKFYTIEMARQDQKSEAEELKKVWEALHRVQLEVARLQRSMDLTYVPSTQPN